MVGLPDSGKSNYAAKLWLSIGSRKRLLKTNGLPENLDYLNEAGSELLRAEFVPHTPRDVTEHCAIPLKADCSGGEFYGELRIPDCSGEQWKGIYALREWSSVWDEMIDENCGCLIFIRAQSDQNVTHIDWIAFEKIYGSSLLPRTNHLPENTEETPTQTLIIDWLQCLRQAFTERVSHSHIPKVAVVVSAWDLVPPLDEMDPEYYLNENYPMLAQFIRANDDRFTFELFGVSVSGGDFRGDPEFKKEYQAGKPLEYGTTIFRRGPEWVRSNDLTLPVAWAMGLDISRATFDVGA